MLFLADEIVNEHLYKSRFLSGYIEKTNSLDTIMSPQILLILFAVFASCLQRSTAMDSDESFKSLFGMQSRDRPPSNDSVTTSAENSADYMLRLLKMFGPIQGNTMLGFTDIGELICNRCEIFLIPNVKTCCGLVSFHLPIL